MSIKYINNGKRGSAGKSTRRPTPHVSLEIPEAKLAKPVKETTQVNKSANKKVIIKEEEALTTLTEEIKKETIIFPVEETPVVIEDTPVVIEEKKEEKTVASLEDIGINSRKIKKILRRLGVFDAEQFAKEDPSELYNKLPEGYLKRETFDKYYEKAKSLI